MKDFFSNEKNPSQVNDALTEEVDTANEVVRGCLLNGVDEHSGHTGSRSMIIQVFRRM